MNVKYFLVFLVVIANVLANDENCIFIYRCCEKVGLTCTKICEPEIKCDIEESTPVAFTPFQIIATPCKSGYRPNSKGICRKVL